MDREWKREVQTFCVIWILSGYFAIFAGIGLAYLCQ